MEGDTQALILAAGCFMGIGIPFEGGAPGLAGYALCSSVVSDKVALMLDMKGDDKVQMVAKGGVTSIFTSTVCVNLKTKETIGSNSVLLSADQYPTREYQVQAPISTWPVGQGGNELGGMCDETGANCTHCKCTHVDFRGPLQCMAKILEREGVKGLFRGYSTMLLRDVSGSVVAVGGVQVVDSAINDPSGEIDVSRIMLMSSSLFAFCGLAYPTDVVRKRRRASAAST
ncbi:unnamed protein product [Phytophthora lilii]|uniref:Unnamed protein product n=1 Tax=Phytophthora lilii TaxID=2077276 RepID=A0A9W6WI31_9STRA|nr:unnamed protein product [Phytophthora lilii]